ncbi:MAG TPA: hypothetical protein VN238_20300 [Solirubrobacteraceae bacterium]|nr:hypothetical protein [Solirubrobacteraceae bacterium]
MTSIDELGVTAERLADLGLLPDDALAVYVSGSLVRGWGNASSDVDVYAITRGPWRSDSAQLQHVALQPDVLPVQITFVEGRRWDVEYWLDTQVDQVLAKVAPEVIEGDQAAGKWLTDDELDFLDRLAYAAPVTGHDWLGERQEQLRASALRSVLVARALNNADLYTEDAVGQLDAGDVESAVLSVKLVFASTIDALLADAGEVAQNPKWRARKFRRAEPPVLGFDDYWRIETMRDFDPDDPAAWVRHVLGVCQEVTMEVAV